jgi:hypothetical protein
MLLDSDSDRFSLVGHYEWHVAFPQPDIDLGAVRARVDEEGILIIDVPRRRRWHAMQSARSAT